ncbi:MAG: MerR family transcriptional regulator [Ruegeria sp.]|nr:MerR family transcriptional regulator [Ruegeria sp.]
MSKSPDAFRTISEVAVWLDVQAHVLRFWESRFSQVKPVKRAGGRRYYRPNDMRLLGGIKKLLHEDGITIKGVQRILREKGVAYVAALSPSLDDVAETDAATDENVVVPFASKPAATGEQVKMDLGESEPAIGKVAPAARAQSASSEPETRPETAKPDGRDDATQKRGIATQAWTRMDFDDHLLKQIAPVARDLRTILNRMENRTAG